MTTHEESVHRQFDPQAQAYLNSAVHAQGPDLRAAHERVARTLSGQSAGLDLGCGAGHLSFALAPAVVRMVAADPSASMLATVAQAAHARGLAQVETAQTHAESLPFQAAAFSFVASRYSAHHWRDVPAALREAHRVTAPGGYLLMIDVIGPADPLVDTHFQTLELLRDTSHVRDYSDREWRAMLADAGYAVLDEQSWPVRLEFASWVQRIRTPMANVSMIRTLQQGASSEVSAALAYEEDGSFTMRTGMYWCQRCD
ncbi:class I SAM-dependent methyltransferase [Verticiella sediminum]|uniref:Class I SAM-dependent methyltransferase n=1 Tax=Verticiella sediminum TaxID=1247510 RepID=A0A556ABE7_9BURK|nr:class I SAM-dependent methyltransferase [Verticiella sediminum]TSH90187.1 class I SAM-dependent methyltransferase [Verticiella sediminum]